MHAKWHQYAHQVQTHSWGRSEWKSDNWKFIEYELIVGKLTTFIGFNSSYISIINSKKLREQKNRKFKSAELHLNSLKSMLLRQVDRMNHDQMVVISSSYWSPCS